MGVSYRLEVFILRLTSHYIYFIVLHFDVEIVVRKLNKFVKGKLMY